MSRVSRNWCAALLITFIFLICQTAHADWWFGGKHGWGERGSGNVITEERSVGDFNRIDSRGCADIIVTVGEEKKVTVRFDDNLIEYIETEVRRQTLMIFTDESFTSGSSCVIEISIPDLESISASGSGDIVVENLQGDEFAYHQTGSGDLMAGGKVERLEIEISGSGNSDAHDLIAVEASVRIRGSGDAEVYATGSLDARVSGSGNLRAEGEVDVLEVQTSGSGDIDASKVVAREVYAKTSGSGNIRVQAIESLEARTSGSGDINYFGEPEHISRRSSGSGDIQRRR